MDRRAPREFLFCLRRSARGRKQIADANSTRRAGVLRARPPAGGVGTVMVTPEANGGTCSTRTGLQRSAHPIPMGAASVGAGNPPPPHRLPLVGPCAVPIPAAGSSSIALHQHIPLLSPLTSRPFLCAPQTPARFLPPAPSFLLPEFLRDADPVPPAPPPLPAPREGAVESGTRGRALGS